MVKFLYLVISVINNSLVIFFCGNGGVLMNKKRKSIMAENSIDSNVIFIILLCG